MFLECEEENIKNSDAMEALNSSAVTNENFWREWSSVKYRVYDCSVSEDIEDYKKKENSVSID